MGKLADSLNKKVDEYISFKDLLSKISEDNNEPLYDVVTYLLHHSLDENVGFYFIDLNFKVFESEYSDINQIHNALSSIKTLLTFDYENWIFTTDNLKELNEHTERELGRILFDNIYIHYKKSEIASFKPLEGLLGFLDIDSKPQVGKEDPQINLLQRDPFLTNLDIFTVIEASCLISGDDPIQIEICLGDTYFKQNNIDYLKAESFINAGIKSGNLDSDITRQSLQKFLLDKGYIIEGFNDTLLAEPLPKTDNELVQQVTDLQSQLATAGNAIASQAERIAELERQLASIEQTAKPSNTPADKELNTKSQNTVAKILNAVLELADLNTNDPYSYDNPTSTNYFIYNQLVKNKMVVKPQTIGKWIELASQQTTDE
jgi:hypothetical protein